jgi:hypothetical protein
VELIPSQSKSVVSTRETSTREGWTLLTVETEANRDSERNPSLVGSLSCRVGTRDFCPALATIVCPVQNMFFISIHYFTSFVPIAQQAGQTVMPGRLSLNMRLWFLRYNCIVQHKHPVVLLSVTEAE